MSITPDQNLILVSRTDSDSTLRQILEDLLTDDHLDTTGLDIITRHLQELGDQQQTDLQVSYDNGYQDGYDSAYLELNQEPDEPKVD